MKFFIDFEATQENEIVSIGIVAESGQTFYSLVKPQFSSISQYISQLIHISNEMVEAENTLDEVFNVIYQWLLSQCPNLAEWEFLAYGTDNKFISASMKNIHSEKATIIAALMIAKMTDVYRDIKTFFHGSISLIHAFNYVENVEKEQKHNPLEDAFMLQKVYEYTQNNEPLLCHPLNPQFDKIVEAVKMPSGTFWCTTGSKNHKPRTFATIDDAIDFFINTCIGKKQRSNVHRERIMKNIMVSVRKGSKYAGYYWHRNKEEKIIA